MCRVSKFWHAVSTVFAPKRNPQFINEMNTHFQNLKPYTGCNLLKIQAPALRVPHYHIVHRIFSSDMMHPFPGWKFPPKNSSIPRENGHISEINNDPTLWEDRKKEGISKPSMIFSVQTWETCSLVTIHFNSCLPRKFVHSKSCSKSERARK